MAAVAVSVFGNPITQGSRAERAKAAARNRNAGGKLDQLLQASHEFEKTIAAEEAVDHYNFHDNTRIGGFDHVNSDNDHILCTGFGGFHGDAHSAGEANRHSRRRKKKTQTTEVSRTTCIIYNATGDPITYVTKHDWEGQAAGRIPKVIQNGQYALLKHVATPSQKAKGSIGAIVFNVQNYTDCMIAWNNPKKTANGEKNTAYCKMEEPGRFNYCNWNKMLNTVRDSKSECETSMEGFTTEVSIHAEDSIPEYRAEFTYNAP